MTPRRIVVTGGASGIGKAVVAELEAVGAEVTVVDLPGTRAEGDAFVGCDLADPASIDAALDRLDGGWSALCNVAGVPGTRPPQQVIAVNFLGLRRMTEGMLERMPPTAAVVNIGSTAGAMWQQNYESARALVDTPGFEEGLAWYREQPAGYPPYNLSKEAVIIYTMVMSAKARDRGIRVNSVSPGPVDTPILSDFEESMGKEMLSWVETTVGRHGTPQDIAPVVAFLAGPASTWINGVNVVVDGGFLAGITAGVPS